MFKKIIAFSFVFFSLINSWGQDTLPNFTTQPIGANKAQISWVNPYNNCVQISVQKSYDSLRFFKSIFSPLSPELPVNGFVDNEYLPEIKTFYRIQYVLENGSFYFSNSRVPKLVAKANTKVANISPKEPKKSILILNDSITSTSKNPMLITEIPKEERIIKVFKQHLDSLKFSFIEDEFYAFKDSILKRTKDTLYSIATDYFVWKPFVPIPQWKPSLHIYTNSNGMINFDFPNYKQHYYRVIIYNPMGKEVLRIKQIKNESLVLEKGNFVAAGWFTFEIYEDEKLKEKNKFYLNRDF